MKLAVLPCFYVKLLSNSCQNKLLIASCQLIVDFALFVKYFTFLFIFDICLRNFSVNGVVCLFL